MSDGLFILDGRDDKVLEHIHKDYILRNIHEQDLPSLADTFEFTALGDKEYARHLGDKNSLIVPGEDGDLLEFRIFNTIEYKDGNNQLKVDVYSRAFYLDLVTAKKINPHTTSALSAESHVISALSGTEIEVGNVDFAGVRSIEFENYTNPYDYIKRVANEFELEAKFYITTDGHTVTGRYVDLTDRVGDWRGKVVEFGRDLEGIKRIEDNDNIVTALYGIGPEKEDGTKLEVFVEDEEAFQRWGRKGQHIVRTYQPQSEREEMTEEELTQYTRTELNKRINSVVTYETSIVILEGLPGVQDEKIRFGDTFRIKDTSFVPSLYLEARVFNQKRDVFNRELKKVKLGDYIEFTEEEIMAIFRSLQDSIQKRLNKLIVVSVSSSSGLIFKNGVGSTNLEAIVFLNAQEVDSDGTTYEYRWHKFDKDGHYVGYSVDGKSITVTASSIDEKASYRLEVILDGEVLTLSEITLTNVFDGEDGEQGPPGEDGHTPVKGVDYFDGKDGQDGSSAYLWVRYSQNANGYPMSDSPTNAKYIGLATTEQPIAPDTYTEYNWNLIKGTDGVPGESGADGKTSYLHIKYSNDGGQTFTANSGEDVGEWIGTYVDFTEADSLNVSDYTWNKVKGEKGDQGVPGVEGPPGSDGQSLYTWVKYADNSSGGGMHDLPNGKTYIGFAYNRPTPVESTDPSDYDWAKIEGPQGSVGSDGVTYYTWLKYADSPTSGMSDSPTGKMYMGLSYNNISPTESTNYNDYSWSLIKGEKGDPGERGLRGLQGPEGDQGIPGEPGEDGRTQYTHIAYADTSTGGGFSQSPTDKAYIGMYVDFEEEDSSTPSKYNWSLIKGADGSNGTPGPKGADGQTPYLHIAYATNSTGSTGFSTTVSAGKTYIGQYTDFTEEDSESPSKYSWTLIKGAKGDKGDKGDTGPQGATGSQGPRGAEGTSVESITEYYLASASASGVTTSTSGWTTTIQPMTTTKKYLWNYERIHFSDGTDQPTIPVIIGVHGATGGTGATGRSITGITEHYLASASSSGVTRSTSGWSTSMQPTSTSKRYLWNYETITWSSGTSPTYVEPIVIGVHGATGATGATGAQGPRGAVGVSVSSVTEYYLATSAASGVTTSTSGWSTAMQTMTTTNKYLWNYEQINFSDGTNQPTIPVIIGVHGATGNTGGTGPTGRSITGITERYLATTAASGVTRSTSGWTTAMQTTTESKKYLWNYETITWSSGTSPTYVEPIIIGVHGATGPKGDTGPRGATGSQGPRGAEGTSVESITEYYLASASASGVTTSTSGWTTTMQTMNTSKKYLWNYERINFSDGTNQPTIPVIIGVHGATGGTGGTGATGRSITGITERYLATTAASGVTRSTSGWTTTMQTTTASKKYLWNYETITWSSGTSPTYVEPIIIGVHGATGSTGPTGPGGAKGDKGDKGDDGKTNLVTNPVVSGSHTGWTNTTNLTSSNQTFEGYSTRVLSQTQVTSGQAQSYSSYFDVDPSKAYRVSMWVKKSAASGIWYLGLNARNASNAAIGVDVIQRSNSALTTNNTNMYFVSGSAASTAWTEWVGYIMPAGTTPADMKGIGKNVANNARMRSDTRSMRVRFLNWNNGTTARTMYVAHPSVIEVDKNAVIEAERARQDALNAQTSADGKNVVFRQSGTPSTSGRTIGDMWFNTGQGNRLSIWTGSWTLSRLDYQALTVGKLSAISADLGDVTTGNLTGVNITGSTLNSTLTANGSVEITGGNVKSKLGTEESGMTKGYFYVERKATSGSMPSFNAVLTSERLSIYNRSLDSIALYTHEGFDRTGGNTNQHSFDIISFSGRASFGARNASYFHMDTDRPGFYMYKPLTVAGRITSTSGLTAGGTITGATTIAASGIISTGSASIDGAGSSARFRASTGTYFMVDGSNKRASLYLDTGGSTSFMFETRDTLNHPFIRAGQVGLKFLDSAAGQVQVRNNTDSAYAQITASEISAANWSPHTGSSVYARPSNAGALHVRSVGTGTPYRPVTASAFNQSSSINFKENIEELNESALDVVNELKVVEYDLIHDKEAGRQIGFISQHNPKIATSNNESIDIYKTVAYNTRATQELYLKMEELLIDNEVLKKRINELEH